MGETENKTNNIFNFLKGLACIGVVLMHISLPGKMGQVIARLCAFAVPLFIMISGYYAYGCDVKKIGQRLKKIVYLFLYGFGVFFLVESVNHWQAKDYNVWLANIISIKAIIKLVVFCTIDYAVPLWYLVAMIETYLFWCFIVKKSKEDIVIRLMPILIVAQIISILVCDSLHLEWFWKINFLTRALAWFVIGYYIHKNEKKYCDYFCGYRLLIGLIIGGCIAVAPMIIGTRLDFSSIGLLIYSLSIFMIGVKYPEKKLSNVVEYIGRYLSTNIYILHCAISWLLLRVGRISISAWIYPLVVIIVTSIVAEILDVIGKVLNGK